MQDKDKCTLFKLYKKLCIKYKIRAKEDKIFKFLLAEKLIKNLYLSENEAIEISKIIKSSASAKKLHKFKKKIYSYAEIYSVKKYNPNATKILSKQEIDFKSVANKLFSELYETKLVQSVIVSYLTKIFHDNL